MPLRATTGDKKKAHRAPLRLLRQGRGTSVRVVRRTDEPHADSNNGGVREERGAAGYDLSAPVPSSLCGSGRRSDHAEAPECGAGGDPAFRSA